MNESESAVGELIAPTLSGGVQMKRLLMVLLTVTALICGAWLTASAETAMVEYVDANGALQDAVEATLVDADNRTWNTGWYAITGEVTINARIEAKGEINLILTDGCKLNITSGITVVGSSSLTIWGQRKGTGELIATGSRNYESGIGGNTNTHSNGKIVINGGTVTATAGNWSAGIGGAYEGSGNNITINGGFVTATGHHGGAGIGGGAAGNYGSGGNANNITITGGTVIASGDSSGYNGGAGIGTGSCGVYEYGNTASNIIITGGNITATGGYGAAGIGGGYGSKGSNITITGGIVTATGRSGAGIGGGMTDDSRSPYKIGYGSDIHIGGDAIVKATGGTSSAGIGGGYIGSGSDISVSGNAYVEAIGSSKGIGGGERGSTSNITFSGGTTIAAAKSADLRAIGAVPTFSDFTHLTYGNATDITPTTTAVEWTDNANDEWTWPWVKIQPVTLSFTFDPTNPTVTLDGVNDSTKSFTLGYTAALADGTIITLSEAAPTWSVSGNQSNGTTIAGGKLTVAADERAAALTVTATLNGTAYTTQVTVRQPTYTVTFDSDGGSAVASQTVSRYTKAQVPSVPTRDGYAFDGWYNGTRQWDFNNEITDNLTLTARWTAIPATAYTITFDAAGGLCNTKFLTTSADGTLEALPTATRDGYAFDGWYTARESGEKITTSTAFHANTTVYARWTAITAAAYTVTFDANGGSCVLKHMQTDADGTLAFLPTAARKGMAFDGWYTALKGGERVLPTTVFTADVTVYAHWTELPKTGDDTPLELWALLMILAVGGMVFSFRRPKKQR